MKVRVIRQDKGRERVKDRVIVKERNTWRERERQKKKRESKSDKARERKRE